MGPLALLCLDSITANFFIFIFMFLELLEIDHELGASDPRG